MIAAEGGTVYIYSQGKKKNLINTVEMGEGMHSTPVVANGVLYLTTRSKLFAIAGKK